MTRRARDVGPSGRKAGLRTKIRRFFRQISLLVRALCYDKREAHESTARAPASLPGFARPCKLWARFWLRRFGVFSGRRRSHGWCRRGNGGQKKLGRRSDRNGWHSGFGGRELERRRRIPSEPKAVPENLLRLSVGVEDVDDLWRDLDQALRSAL